MTDQEILELIYKTAQSLKEYVDKNTIKNVYINGENEGKDSSNNIEINIVNEKITTSEDVSNLIDKIFQ